MISQVWELKNRFINLQKEKKQQTKSDNYVTYTFNHDQLGEEVMLMSFPNRTMIKGYNLNGTDYIADPIVTQETTEISEFVLTDKGYCTTSLMTIDSLTVNTRWRAKQPLSENDQMVLVTNLGEAYELQPVAISAIPQMGMLYDYGNNEYGFPQEVIDQLQPQDGGANLGIFFAESTWDGSTIPTIDTEVAYVKTSGGIQNISIVPTSNTSELTIYCTDAFNDLGYCNKEIVRKIDGGGCNSITSIKNYTFDACTSLISVVIPNNVTSIGYHTFYNCSGLTNIIIPNSVTSIGTASFQGTGLISIEIPNSVTRIETQAFSYCDGLTSVTIGNGVTYMGGYVFSSCANLTGVVIGNGVTDIGEHTFDGCTGLTSIEIPGSVTKIGSGVFDACTSLTSVTIGNGVTSIGSSAFKDCTSLVNIEIPNSVTSIGGAFYNCTSLTSITIPNSVTSIESMTFEDCTNLTSIIIPNSVTSIGGGAFRNCTQLTEISSLNPTPPVIDSTTFKYIGRGVLKVPKGSDYSSWMGTSAYYLGYYNWTIEEIETV